MSERSLFWKRRLEVPCTVEVEHTAESLHAHVELDDDVELAPGDEVCVIDAPERPPYGEKVVVRRRALVTRASAIESLCRRLVGDLGLTELYDVSFSEKRSL
ncbi:hypothetical protein M2322_001559 [Rhodoblastus acidophilus]|nr:hypothetical protein [Rhodoblastus acidophilus]MCW2316015.1 hypothetical protein [Rhodoblastus acidophilus]